MPAQRCCTSQPQSQTGLTHQPNTGCFGPTPPAVLIDDVVALPEDYVRYIQRTEPDPQMIARQRKAGTAIPGCASSKPCGWSAPSRSCLAGKHMLAGKHKLKGSDPMTTDERIEALTQSVELLSRMHQDNEQRNTQYFAVISQSLQKLTDIAENHEERVTKLENGNG